MRHKPKPNLATRSAQQRAVMTAKQAQRVAQGLYERTEGSEMSSEEDQRRAHARRVLEDRRIARELGIEP